MTSTTLSTLTSLRILIPLIMVVAAVAVFLEHCKTREGGEQLPVRAMAAVLLGIYLLIYLYLTFGFRRPTKAAIIWLEPFRSYREAFSLAPFRVRRLGMARQILLNILLTIPAGLLLPVFYRVKHPYRLALVTILALSVLTETMQYITRLGIFETDDLMDNLLGGLIGMGILRGGSILLRRIKRDKQTEEQI